MKPTAPFTQGLEKIRRERKAGRYKSALAGTNRLLESWPDNPFLLVIRAELIQLQDLGPELEEAKISMQRAVELAPDSAEPLIEIGHFLFAVEDDGKKALPYFDKSIEMCKQQLKESLLGKAKVLDEMERRQEALACLAEAYWLESHNGQTKSNSNGQEILHQLEELRRAE